jgi:flagellar hook-basal body complex protein FliE
MIDAISPARAPTVASATAGRTDLSSLRTDAAAATTEAAGADFGAMLTRLASDAAGVVRHAESMSIAGVQGSATVQQVVEAVMNAEHTLQGAVAIRDKVVAAYLEISRMQI